MLTGRLACRDCGVAAIPGAWRCLRCGGELVVRRRLVSSFGPAAARERMRRRAMATSTALMVVLSCVALLSIALAAVHDPAGPGRTSPLGDSGAAPLPAAPATLAGTSAPREPRFERVLPRYVQESCVGRFLPGDVQPSGWPPAVIDGNPRTAWRCDGDGARLRSPQSLTVFFAQPVTLASIGIIGYDPVQPCRFVTSMELIIGTRGYQIRLPASLSGSLRWFAAPPVRADRLTLVVTATTAPRGRTGPDCSRTAIAEAGFAVRR
jgi:hypothetical protein